MSKNYVLSAQIGYGVDVTVIVFVAKSAEDRDEWVQAIEQQILNSLQVESSTSYITCYTIISLRAMRVVRQEAGAETIWATMPQYRD